MDRISRTLWVLPVAALLIGMGAAQAWAVPVFIGSTTSLESGNGNKIVTGPHGSLHAVAEVGGVISYRTSTTGTTWGAVTPLSGTLQGRSPTIAVDRSGGIGVLWVANPNSAGIGSMYYSYKSMASSTWQHRALPAVGREPSIAAAHAGVFLTWATVNKIQYTSFPTMSPPPTPTIQNVVVETMCKNTGFRWPSVTVTVSPDPCAPTVRVAYLYYSDEQDTQCPGGSWFATKVGPVVRQRNPLTGAWDEVYSNVNSSTSALSSVEPVSLSMATRYHSGETFLAWSDVQDGNPRTQVAHVAGAGPWASATLAAQARRVHVRAPGVATPVGQFRLAYSTAGVSSTPVVWSTGTWTGSAPVWGAWTTSYITPAAWPQALFWSSCPVTGVPQKAQVYTELPSWLSNFTATLDVSAGACALAEPVIPIPSCTAAASVATIAAGARSPGTSVDVSELGTLVSVGATSAQVRTYDRRTALISWTSGQLVSYSEDTIVINAPRSAVSVVGQGFQVPIVEAGHLVGYDNVTTP